MNPTKVAFFKETYNATDKEIDQIRKVDPTTNCDSAAWILKGIRAGCIRNADAIAIRSALLTFDRLKTSPKMKAEGLSTDLLTYESLASLYKVTGRYWDLLSNKQKAREFQGAELLYHEGPWKFYRVFEAKAAVQLGSGSRWCTTQLGTAEDYLRRAQLWVVHFYDKPYCQLHVESNQCQDVNNNYFFHDHNGCRFLKDYHVGRILHKFTNYAEIETFLSSVAPVLEPGPEFYEVMLKKTREVLVSHLSFFRRRVPEIEAKLFSKRFEANEESQLLLYLSNFDKAEDFEPYVDKDPLKAWCYSLTFKKPLPKEKEKLLNKTNYFIPYLNRFGDAASHVFEDLDTVAAWVKDNPQVRNESAEKLLLRHLGRIDFNLYSRYARLAMKGRWEELEKEDRFRKEPKFFNEYSDEMDFPVIPVSELKVTGSSDEMVPIFYYAIRWAKPEEMKELLDRFMGPRVAWSTRHCVAKYWLYTHQQKNRVSPEIEAWLETLTEDQVREGAREWSGVMKDYLAESPTLGEVFYKIAQWVPTLQSALYERLENRDPLFEKYLGSYENNLATNYIRKYGVDDEATMLRVLPIYDRLEFAIKKGIRLPEADESRITTWETLDKYITKCIPQGTRVPYFESLFSKFMVTTNVLSVEACGTYMKKAWKTTPRAKIQVPEGFELTTGMKTILEKLEWETKKKKKPAKKAEKAS